MTLLSVCFLAAVLVSFGLGVVFGYAIWGKPLAQLKAEGSEGRKIQKLTSCRMNIGNRIYRVLRVAAAKNPNGPFSVVTMDDNGDSGYSIRVESVTVLRTTLLCCVLVYLVGDKISINVIDNMGGDSTTGEYEPLENTVRYLTDKLQERVVRYHPAL